MINVLTIAEVAAKVKLSKSTISKIQMSVSGRLQFSRWTGRDGDGRDGNGRDRDDVRRRGEGAGWPGVTEPAPASSPVSSAPDFDDDIPFWRARRGSPPSRYGRFGVRAVRRGRSGRRRGVGRRTGGFAGAVSP